MSTKDDRSSRQIEVVIEALAMGARLNFETDHSVAPIAFVLSSRGREPHELEVIPVPEPLGSEVPDKVLKHMWSEVIASTARFYEARAVVVIAEAWRFEAAGAAEVATSAQQAIELAQQGRLSEMPGVTECVSLSVESDEVPDREMVAKIERGDGRVVLGPWQVKLHGTGGQSVGSFVGLLPSRARGKAGRFA